MIEKIRAYSSTWWFRSFLGAIAVIFAVLWGGGDWMHNMGGGHTQMVAKVGSERITATQLRIAVDRKLRQIALTTGQRISEEEALKAGLFQDVLRALIDETLLIQEAKRLGITLTDAGVREAIKKNPIFLNESGAFDKKRFDMIIDRLGFSESAFVEETRKELMRASFMETLFDDLRLPALASVTLYRWQGQTRQLVYSVIKSDNLTFKGEPTQDDIKAMFVAHKNILKAPEYRDFSVLVLDPKAVEVNVGDEDVKRVYDERQASFEGKTYVQVKDELTKEVKHQKALEALYELAPKVEDAVGSGMTMQEVADKFKLELRTFTHLDTTGAPDPFGADASKHTQDTTPLTQAFVREAFSLEAQSAGAVVEGPDQVSFIVHVDKVQDAHFRAWNEIEAERAKALWTAFKKKEMAAELAKKIGASSTSVASFLSELRKNNLKSQKMSVSRAGSALTSSVKLPEGAVARVFETPVGGAVLSPLGASLEDTQIFVGCVESVQDPNTQNAAQEDITQKTNGFNKLYENDFIASYVASLRKRFPVEINQKWLKTLQAGSPA